MTTETVSVPFVTHHDIADLGINEALVLDVHYVDCPLLASTERHNVVRLPNGDEMAVRKW